MKHNRLLALLTAALLFLVPVASATDHIAYFHQAEGIERYALEEFANAPVPQGLEVLYGLFAEGNPEATVYVFRMPNGQALLSISCLETGAEGSVDAVYEQREQLAKSLMDSMDGMMALAPTFELKEMYGQQAITAPVVLDTPGEPEAQLQLEGQVTAFYRGEDLIEVWTCYPGMVNYLFDQEATDALSGDLEALEAFEASLDFSLPQKEDDGIPDAFVNFLQDKEEPETQQQSPHMTITADDGTFRMDVPVDTTVIHAGSDEDAVARARTLFADVEGGEECFDLWYQDVQSLNCWLLISREQRVAAQVYVNEAGSFKGMTAEDMLQLEQPVLEMMQQQYDHAELSDESCVAEIAGKEHSMMTYSLDKGDMHLLTFVMAAVDEVNLYELDVYAVIDEKTDTDAVIETVTMMIESLEYLPELGV